MRKLVIALILTGLMALGTVGAAMAHIDGPPPDVPGCRISDAARAGHGSGEMATSTNGFPAQCFSHP